MLPALIPLAAMNVLATVDLKEMESTAQVRMNYHTVKLMLIHSVANDNKRSIVLLQLLMDPHYQMKPIFTCRY